MSSISRSLLVASSLFVLAAGAPLPAQMVSGPAMTDFNKVFNLPAKPGSVGVDYLGCDSPANILYPGEQPTFKFRLHNTTGTAITGSATAELVPFGTKGAPGDIWVPIVIANGDKITQPVTVNIPANGQQDLSVKFDVPEKMGGYGIVFDLGANGRVFGTSLARTFPATPADNPYPKMLLDAGTGLAGLDRLGVRTVRMEWGFSPNDANQDAQLAQRMADFKAHHITVLMVLEAGPNAKQPVPDINFRHWLADNDMMMLGYGGDRAWLPSEDPAFRQWTADVCQKYGWPNGPLTAVSLWNEPWEGASISAWGADMPRYREMFKQMALGVHDARAKGAQVLVASCDSSTNAWDKLFSDGTDDYLQYLDAVTIHYQGIGAPSTYKKWINRTGPMGRVQVWDTESWVANTDDRVAVVVATDRAAGYDRHMGVYYGNVTTALNGDTGHAWPAAAAVGAAQHFIGERSFKQFLFQKGLPWIFVFDGLNNNPDDGSVVVAGDVGEALGEDFFPFRGVRGLNEPQVRQQLEDKLAALPAGSPDRATIQGQLDKPITITGGQLSFPDNGHFKLFDFYGNAVPADGGQVKVPLDFRGYFLRTDGTPGSFAQLLDALRTARVDGFEPLNIVSHDALAPMAEGGSFRISLGNVLNRAISGKLSVTIAGAPATVATPDLSFQPFETKEVTVQATGTPTVDNSYPITVTFDAGADGKATRDDILHVNQIAHRTIKVDGDLSDWQGVLPQAVKAQGTGAPSLTEAAWLPFKNFPKDLTQGFATTYMAYDDNYFYFAARIADSTPDVGTYRFATRPDDTFYYPKVSYTINTDTKFGPQQVAWTPPAPADALKNPADDKNAGGNKIWSSVKIAGLGFYLHPDSGRLAIHLVKPPGGASHVNFTFLNDSGGIILKKTLPVSADGSYALFDLNGGGVYVVARGEDDQPIAFGGIFLDKNPAPASGPGTHVAYVSTDSDTKGNWIGKYGASGHWLAGGGPTFDQGIQFQGGGYLAHTWPDGVRQYTYRKDAYLPSGNYPNMDNVQIAFNVLPEEKKDMLDTTPGTMPGFVPSQDTDYEYALNKVAPQYGGGTEIWRLRVPGMTLKNFYPREPKGPFDGAVKGGKLVVKYVGGNTRIVEAAIPWSELPDVKAAADAGKTIKFTFRINDNGGVGMELAQNRNVSKLNPHTLHAEWVQHWSNDVEFAFEKKPAASH